MLVHVEIQGQAEAADPEGFEPLLNRLDFIQYEELSEKILEAKTLVEIPC